MAQAGIAKNNRLMLSFLGILAGTFTVWYLLYQFWLEPWGLIDEYLVTGIAKASVYVLLKMGYEVHLLPPDMIYTGLYPLIYVGKACNGLMLYALYVCFMLAIPGQLRHKLWYIPLGLSIIYGVNVLRVSLLGVMLLDRVPGFEFSHHFIFYMVVYGIIMGLWWWWLQSFSGLVKHKKAPVSDGGSSH